MSEQQKATETIKKAEQKAEKQVDEAAEEASGAIEDVSHTIATKAEEIKDAAVHAAHDVADSVTPKAEEFASEAKKEFENVSEKAKEFSENFSDKVVNKIQEPAVSTTILFTTVTASAASTYLTQQHKVGKLTPLVTAGVVVGIAALSVAEYFSVKAYFRKNNSA